MKIHNRLNSWHVCSTHKTLPNRQTPLQNLQLIQHPLSTIQTTIYITTKRLTQALTITNPLRQNIIRINITSLLNHISPMLSNKLLQSRRTRTRASSNNPFNSLNRTLNTHITRTIQIQTNPKNPSPQQLPSNKLNRTQTHSISKSLKPPRQINLQHTSSLTTSLLSHTTETLNTITNHT